MVDAFCQISLPLPTCRIAFGVGSTSFKPRVCLVLRTHLSLVLKTTEDSKRAEPVPEACLEFSLILWPGLCNSESCLYRHVNVNPNASVCEGFLRGYCADGNEVMFFPYKDTWY